MTIDDQLQRRFSSWSLRALSYAGRTMLFSYVIYSTINFWFSSFILPNGCIKQIESLWSRFLWNGNISSRAAAKVSWSAVYLPLEEGGLGFKIFTYGTRTSASNLYGFSYVHLSRYGQSRQRDVALQIYHSGL